MHCHSNSKAILALAATFKRRVKQGDFIGAFLQARARSRIFIRLDPKYKEHFPELTKWFGVPLLLKRGIYGLSVSGKYWAQESAEWLLAQGFHQSTADTTYFIKYYPNGSWIRLIYYVDDLLYYGSNDRVEKIFEQSISNRFKIKFNGNAQWFLQMRIHQYADYSYSIDQYRFAKNILHRYCPDDAPFGTPKHRTTPAPSTYVYSKKNRPTDKEKKQLEIDYKGLDFRSAVCSLLYLALGTRGDILFIVNKLSNACTAPG